MITSKLNRVWLYQQFFSKNKGVDKTSSCLLTMNSPAQGETDLVFSLSQFTSVGCIGLLSAVTGIF